MAVAISTWSFGLEAVAGASKVLDSGEDCVRAVELAVKSVENDPTTGVYGVGRGSCPDANGIIQLDAGIMRGSDCAIGAVCALEQYPAPISVARHIMENSKHNMLVGKGAQTYAINNGFELEDNESLLINTSCQIQQEYATQQTAIHDTFSLLCLDVNGQVAAGVSTSGSAHKAPGRVGDSPLPGCGYYADSDVGAAAATGDGETLMKYCPSFQVVELMRQGYSPCDACERVLKNIVNREKKMFEAGLIALNIKGCTGASGTVKEWKDARSGVVYHAFPYVMWVSGKSPVIETVSPCVMHHHNNISHLI